MTRRCSASPLPETSRSLSATGIPIVRSIPAGTGCGGGSNPRSPTLIRDWRRSRMPSPLGAPSWSALIRAAVSGLTTISPAAAVPSIVTVVLAVAPVMISSR